MSRYRLGVIFAFLLLGVMLSGCSLPATHTYYVTTTGNDTNNCLSSVHACRTVSAAVSKATPRSTINIGAGTFPVAQEVGKWLAFVGAGQTTTILSRTDPSGPTFRIDDAVHASFSNMTINGGRTGIEVDGYNIATQLTATYVTFTNSGWGITNLQGCAITLANVTMTNNNFGITTIGGTLSVLNSVFRGNRFIAIENSSIAVLDHVTIDQNGGGVENAGSTVAVSNTTTGSAVGRIKIVYSTITNNHGDGLGSTGGRASVSASQISNNGGAGIDAINLFVIDTSVVSSNAEGGISAGLPAGASGGEATDLQISQVAVINNGGNAGVQTWSGTATITNSTISSNRGVGVSNVNARLTLAFDTISGNRSYGLAGNGYAPIAVQNSIIAVNGSPNCFDLGSEFSMDTGSRACNDSLTTTSLHLAALTHDAGTWDMPLQSGSPAINAARPDSACPAMDQRGYTRPSGAHCDVGAYEFGAGTHLEAATGAPTLALVSGTATAPLLEIITNTPTITPVTPTDTPAVQVPPQVTFLMNANCRKGPGTAYDVATSFAQGGTLPAVGRTADSSWWQVQIQPGSNCWVGKSTVSTSGPVDGLPVVVAPALPDAPGKVTNVYACDTKSTKTLTVILSWTGVPGAAGYDVYRNGSLIKSVGGGTTTYTDKPAPMGVALTYALEAFNGVAHSAQVTTSVPACK